jgi:uncharacterized protein YmfQ (DUF2313 family)
MAVARPAEAYAAHLASLLPRGDLWERGADPTMDKLLLWMGRELARIDQRIVDLLREADPREAVEMLPDWEAEVGLPDPCSGPAATLSGRRAEVLQRLRMQGGASRPYFIALADTLGYPGATITEFRPFTARSACTHSVTAPAWWWTWRLNIAAAFTIRRFTARSACDEPIRAWGDAALECIVRRLKPAHTHVLFSYAELP